MCVWCICPIILFCPVLILSSVGTVRRTTHFGGTSPFGDHSTIRRVSLGHTGGGKHRSFFSSSYIYFQPHLSPAVLTFIFIARRVRSSLSLVDSGIDVCVYSRACRFQLLGSNVRKKSQFVFDFARLELTT